METLTIVFILIILKLNGVITISWIWVLFPIWGAFAILGGLFSLLFLYMFIYHIYESLFKPEPKSPYDIEGIMKIRNEINKNKK
jgi:hypothetical protein